ncbi:MAG: hypothetical protein VX940_13280 [Pseudomonadota bacterium]|nr:hypothetical protein [Pseudomonadota bacterium]
MNQKDQNFGISVLNGFVDGMGAPFRRHPCHQQGPLEEKKRARVCKKAGP